MAQGLCTVAVNKGYSMKNEPRTNTGLFAQDGADWDYGMLGAFINGVNKAFERVFRDSVRVPLEVGPSGLMQVNQGGK